MLTAQSAAGLALRPPSMTLSDDSGTGSRFVAVHGRSSVIMGYSNQGLEVWGYPFQILTGLRIGFRLFTLREASDTGPLMFTRDNLLAATRTGGVWTAVSSSGIRRMVPFTDVGASGYSTYIHLDA